MFGILDAVILILLLMGVIFGAKRGLIRGAVNCFGMIAIIIIAYILKNPLADLLFSIFPFIDYKEFISGATVINILFFEMIAFIIVFAILLFLFRILLKMSKFVEKILDATIVGGLFSKILGAIFGFLEYYVIAFIVICILTLPIFGIDASSSKLATFMLDKTPVMSSVIQEKLQSIEEITALAKKYEHNNKSNEYNVMAIDYMLKGGVITVKTADKLVEKGRLNYSGINTVIDKYRK